MPNRILREGLLDSDAVGEVSPMAELLFVRLMLLADDFGRYDGRASVVCRRAWVNRRTIDEQTTDEWLTELHQAGLIERYAVDGKPLLVITNFRQRSRASGSKYPAPPSPGGGASVEDQALSRKDVRQTTDKRQTEDGPPRTYSYSDSYSSNTPLPPCQGEEAGGAAACGDRPARDGDDEAPPGGVPSVRLQPQGIKAWLAACSLKGEKPIPEGCAALVYAAQAGIPPEVLQLHWREFKVRHVESAKRYRDWRQTFLNSLRGNWYGLWFLNADGTCTLSTKGLQAQRVQQAGGEAQA